MQQFLFLPQMKNVSIQRLKNEHKSFICNSQNLKLPYCQQVKDKKNVGYPNNRTLQQ